MITIRLPEIMRRRGISIRELSRVTGITYTTIHAVYHGQRRSIQLSVLDAICQALDVQPGDVIAYLPPGGPWQEVPDARATGKEPVARPKRPDSDWSVWE